MSFQVNQPLNRDTINAELEECFAKFRNSGFTSNEEETLLKSVKKSLKRSLSWAHEYDFRQVQANGYWSMVRMTIKLFHFVLQRNTKKLRAHLFNVMRLFERCLLMIETTRSDSLKARDSEGNLRLHSPSVSLTFDLLDTYLSSEEAITGLTGPLAGFQSNLTERNARNAYVIVIAIHAANNVIDAFRCITSSEHRGRVWAKTVRKMDVQFIKRVFSLGDFEPLRSVIPFLLYGSTPSAVTINVERQREWVISANGDICDRICPLAVDRNNGGRIRCRLIKKEGGNQVYDKCLVLNCHGGGFVAQSPDTHEVYLRDWANQLPGIAIISIDYSLSPEAKFPVALQEILDVYLWSTDPESDAEEVIGFLPQRVVVCGDSAGGNMAMSLTLILNDIRGKCIQKGETFQMIDGVVCYYPGFSVKPNFTPSHFVTCCDTFLSAMVLVNALRAYVPVNSRGGTASSWQDQGLSNDGLIKRAFNCLKWMLPFGDNNSNDGEAWFSCEKSEFTRRVGQFGDVFDHPYVSPLQYKDFNSLSDIPLHLIALHFDPLLDDSVEMAKKWKGQVTLDVLDGLCHGFLHFIHMSEEARHGSNLCVSRLKQVLKLY